MMKKIGLFLLSFILIIIMLEIILRFTYQGELIDLWQTSGAHQLDADLIYVNTPKFDSIYSTEDFTEKAHINSLGFRSKEIGNKNEHSIRVVVVGDSFAFGHGIADNQFTFPARLEEKLQSLYKDFDIEVINTGVKGYSPDQEYRFIKTRSLNLSPDYIIWILNDHDFHNLLYFPSLYDLDTSGRLKTTSAKMTWMYWQGYAVKNIPSFFKKSKLVQIAINSFVKIPYLNRSLLVSKDKRIVWAGNKLLSEIRSVDELLKANKIPLLIVFIPTKDVYTNDNNEDLSDPSRLFISRLMTKLDQIDIPIYDLGKIIADHYQDLSTGSSSLDTLNHVLGVEHEDLLSIYFNHDYHLNEKGTDFVADLLQQEMSLYFEDRVKTD